MRGLIEINKKKVKVLLLEGPFFLTHPNVSIPISTFKIQYRLGKKVHITNKAARNIVMLKMKNN